MPHAPVDLTRLNPMELACREANLRGEVDRKRARQTTTLAELTRAALGDSIRASVAELTRTRREQARRLMTEELHYEGLDAEHEGRASELFDCPADDSLQGVTRRRIVAGHPQGFDGGEVITLRCGHQLV
jgi:hypothetical protein